MASPTQYPSLKRRKRVSSPMDGATIYYVGADSAAWAEYLRNKLSEEEYNIPAVLSDITSLNVHIKNSKPNVLLVSPEFAELESWGRFASLNPQQSMAVLLNISKQEFNILCKDHRNCPELLQWQIDSMEATDDSVRHLLLSIIRIYEGLDDYNEDDAFDGSQISPSLRVHPEFHLQASDEDPIYDVPPFTREKNELHKVIHDERDHNTVYIILDREADNEIDIVRTRQTEVKAEYIPKPEVKAEYIPKSIYRFKLPGDSHEPAEGSFKFSVYSGSQDLGKGEVKCGSKLELIRNLLAEELSPVSLLCQAMGIPRGNLEELDAKMTQTIKQWRPLRFMQHFEGPVASIEGQTKCPTLLHFGVQYHLENFCRELINYPGMVAACVTLNSDGDYPNDIARREGFDNLANELESFVKEYANMAEQNDRNCDSGVVVGDIPSPCLARSSDYVPMHGIEDTEDTEKPPIPPRNSAEQPVQEDTYMMMTDPGTSRHSHSKPRHKSTPASLPNSPHTHRHRLHSHTGHSTSHEKHRHSDSPRLPKRHPHPSGHRTRTDSYSLDKENEHPATPSSSRPNSGHLSSSPVVSPLLSASPVNQTSYLSRTCPPLKYDYPDVQKEHLVKDTEERSQYDDISKTKTMKGMRRSSSGSLSKKISNFLSRLKKPGRKMSVPEIPTLYDIQRNSSTKFYTRHPSDEVLSEKGSRPNSLGSGRGSAGTRPNSESERDSGSYDGDESVDQNSPTLRSSARSSPVSIPVISPRRPPAPIHRQKSVRINNAMIDSHVFAPPLPERRPLKHGDP